MTLDGGSLVAGAASDAGGAGGNVLPAGGKRSCVRRTSTSAAADSEVAAKRGTVRSAAVGGAGDGGSVEQLMAEGKLMDAAMMMAFGAAGIGNSFDDSSDELQFDLFDDAG